jgi:hypothetical protein
MARNPVLFPDTFGSGISRLPIGKFGDEGATTFWVKQMIVEMFYGRGVPLFSFDEGTVSWGDGMSYFDGVTHTIQQGSYLFESIDGGWYYVYAHQQDGQTSQVVVSGSPPTLAAQQLWWNLRVEGGVIEEVIPAKAGFGV